MRSMRRGILIAAAVAALGAGRARAEVMPQPVDVTAITGQSVVGAVTSWTSQDGPNTVEHVAGLSPAGDVLVFFRSSNQDWLAVNVSAITGQRVVSPLVSWLAEDASGTVEHLAGRNPSGDLLVFYWSQSEDWQVVNVSALTGQKIDGPVTSWIASDSSGPVEHLAGRSPSGDLLVFYWSPLDNWQVVNVTALTGQKVAGPMTSWLAEDSGGTVEHVAGASPTGDLLVFHWSQTQNWQVVNVTALTGEKVAGPVTSWTAKGGNETFEHVAGAGPDSKLRVFYYAPSIDWRVADLEQIAGGRVAPGAPTSWQLTDGSQEIEALAVRGASGALLHYWWSKSRDWLQIDLSDITGHPIAGDPTSWQVNTWNTTVESIAATDPQGHLLVFQGFAQPRRLTESVTAPFKGLDRTRSNRKVVVILWDPHRPDHLAPPREEVERLFTGETLSVRDYFLENSNGQFTIDVVAVLGWYDADKPADHYWGETKDSDPNDADGDGWRNGHVEKWAEAIRKADAEFDFSTYDTDRNGVLAPSELGIAIVIPSNGVGGFVRDVFARDFPHTESLSVDRVRATRMAEFYIGRPVNRGIVAHELSHLLLGAGDMYCQKENGEDFYCSTESLEVSLMSRHIPGAHMDPFHKLKLGWVHPKLIFRGGHRELESVEREHDVWILLDPARRQREYFIVENRWGEGSYDRGMEDDGGLAVWHVIEDPGVYGALPPPPFTDPLDWSSSVAPGDWGRRAVQLLRTSLEPPYKNGRVLFDRNMPGADYDLLSEDGDPDHPVLRWADGTPSGFNLRDISAAGPTMSAVIDTP